MAGCTCEPAETGHHHVGHDNLLGGVAVHGFCVGVRVSQSTAAGLELFRVFVTGFMLVMFCITSYVAIEDEKVRWPYILTVTSGVVFEVIGMALP